MVRPCAAATPSITALPSAASSGVQKAGIHPSASRPQRSSAAGRLPPSQTSKGSCTGRGETDTPANTPAGPSWLTSSPDHKRRSTGRASSICSPRAAVGIPTALRSAPRTRPGTNVNKNRPPESTSSVATALASQTRLRPGRSMVVPIFIPGQAPDTQANPTSGSGPGRVSTSGSHSESKPVSATVRPSPAIASGPRLSPPALIPMRTFMGCAPPVPRPAPQWRGQSRRRRRRGG